MFFGSVLHSLNYAFLYLVTLETSIRKQILVILIDTHQGVPFLLIINAKDNMLIEL